MHKLTFFPLGNADCCRVDLAGGEKLLFDYANMRCADDANDRRIDLPGELRKDLRAAKRDFYDVVAFTHLDTDHIAGASEFFELRHAKKYQGEGRVKINQMWVPAYVITEEGCTDEARIIQAEARYRLQQGEGIRVFSRPAALETWLKSKGLSLASRQPLITDAGQTVPDFSKTIHGVEFFVHSPFARRQDDGSFTDRNTNNLVLHATFAADGRETKLFLAADSTHEVLSEIVNITRAKGRATRLEWDVCKIPHHSSYLSLGPDKGKEKTEPVSEVQWLFETRGQAGGIMVSTSWPIPSDDADDQPPHRQAANYYRQDVAESHAGQFKVTMSHPNAAKPAPLVLKIDYWKAGIELATGTIGTSVISTPAPRAG